MLQTRLDALYNPSNRQQRRSLPPLDLALIEAGSSLYYGLKIIALPLAIFKIPISLPFLYLQKIKNGKRPILRNA